MPFYIQWKKHNGLVEGEPRLCTSKRVLVAELSTWLQMMNDVIRSNKSNTMVWTSVPLSIVMYSDLSRPLMVFKVISPLEPESVVVYEKAIEF